MFQGSLSFQEEKDFIFAEVPVMEMMLALGASLCSASPCRQVDAQENELPSVLPVKIFLRFPLLNLLSTFFFLSLAVITVPHLLTTLGFSLSPCECQPRVLYCRCCGASSLCAEPQPSIAGCSWHPVPEAGPWLSQFLFAPSAASCHKMAQNGPAVELPSTGSCHLL